MPLTASLLMAFACVVSGPVTEPSQDYDQWRTQWPARDLTPRPDDGKRLALTIRKFEHAPTPERPLLIWAIGSSYTNMLGMGEIPIELIRRRFPDAPEIVYKKHVGASVSYQYLLGWARHIVIPEQPDVVLIYTIGKAEDLDRLLSELRRGCTADIIVPSIHWRMRDIPLWDKSENAVDQDVAAVRAVCEKHGVEFVENRREWAEHLKTHGLKIEIDAENNLLKDAVHQSDYGKLIINENIARHFAHPDQFAYDPDQRERRLHPADWHSVRDGESIEYDDGWKVREGQLVSTRQGASLKVHFQGNRIDVIGTRSANGGEIDVQIDGQPADQVDAFFMNFIQVGKDNVRPERGLVTDRAPHGVTLGANVVPQTWTITMLDDDGNYELVGSVTGPDGRANNIDTFTSASGQITVPAELWRYNRDRQGQVFNKQGDTFSWDVYRTGVGAVDFRGEDGELFSTPLIRNLSNAPHTLELTARDRAIRIDAFDIFEPPLK